MCKELVGVILGVCRASAMHVCECECVSVQGIGGSVCEHVCERVSAQGVGGSDPGSVQGVCKACVRDCECARHERGMCVCARSVCECV